MTCRGQRAPTGPPFSRAHIFSLRFAQTLWASEAENGAFGAIHGEAARGDARAHGAFCALGTGARSLRSLATRAACGSRPSFSRGHGADRALRAYCSTEQRSAFGASFVNQSASLGAGPPPSRLRQNISLARRRREPSREVFSDAYISTRSVRVLIPAPGSSRLVAIRGTHAAGW